MYKKINLILFVVLSILSFSLIAAYFIEYNFGYKPCKLCLYERIPYFISILLILNILLIKKFKKISLLLISIVSLVSFFLAFYHFGIEQGFFSESFFCNAQNSSQNLTKSEILDQLKTNQISCKNVDFYFFGISLASINTILSFLIFVIFFKLYKNYEID